MGGTQATLAAPGRAVYYATVPPTELTEEPQAEDVHPADSDDPAASGRKTEIAGTQPGRTAVFLRNRHPLNWE